MRLRTSRCQATFVAGLWRRRHLASAFANGAPETSVSGALQSLRAAVQARAARAWRPDRRPAVRLTVPDERVYYALLPARGTWSQQIRQAEAHFGAMLGRDDLAVRSTLLPGGHHWLAAAIEPDDLRSWTAAIHQAGGRLAQLRPALADDLDALAGLAGLDHALLVLLRDEGAMLVVLDGQRPCGLMWLRFGAHDAQALLRGVRAFDRTVPGDSKARRVVLVPQDLSQYDHWSTAAANNDWLMLAPLQVSATPEASA